MSAGRQPDHLTTALWFYCSRWAYHRCCGTRGLQPPTPEWIIRRSFPGTVNPTSVPYEGGRVTLTAEAADDFGTFLAYAEVLQQDNLVYVQFFPAGETGLTTCAGTASIPQATPTRVSYGGTSTSRTRMAALS